MSNVVVTIQSAPRDPISVARRTTSMGQALTIIHIGDNTLCLHDDQALELVAAVTAAHETASRPL